MASDEWLVEVYGKGERGKMERAKVSLRISTYLWLDERRREELLGLLKRYGDTIEEVAFFSAFTHSLLPLAVIEERAGILGEVIPRFKALGLSVGINHLATLGHMDENLPHSLNEPWQRLMDIEGRTNLACYCPADPDVQRYLGACYTALAKARPDFIWIDDDVRLIGHGPVRFACFCDRCLARFDEESGKRWSRESLRAAFNGGSIEERLALRKQWLAHNRALVTELLAGIRAAVDSIDSSIVLGLMTGDRFYEGSAFEEYARALAGPRGIKVMWRPGGGFYADATPLDMLDKAHAMGRQVALLPADVTDVQSEIESFPYQRLRKSATITATEGAAYIGAGCTGGALNVMGISPDPFEEYLPLFDKVREFREFYDRAVAAFGRSPCEGMWAAVNRDYFAGMNLEGEWLRGHDFTAVNSIRELCEIGLPVAYSEEGARVAVLAASACRALSQEELLRILSGGVILDGQALAALNGLGLSALTGFEVAGTKEADTIEVFTEDALNGRFAGWQRDCRPSFWPETACVFEPVGPDCRMLSYLTDFAGGHGAATSGVFENERGGRVAVFGYYPWRLLQSLAKTSQLKSVCRWLSRDRLPAYVESYEKVALWCRRDAQGHPALLLINVSFDAVARLTLNVRDVSNAMLLTRTDCATETLVPRAQDGAYASFGIQGLRPWEVALLAQAG